MRISIIIFLLVCFKGISQPFNNVALLNGQDDFIEIPNNFASGFTNGITIEAWLKPCAINGHRMILTKFYCVGNNNQFYFTILDGKLRWAWDNTGCADGANFYETGVVVQANVWQHVAVTHTSSGVTIYHNGLPVAGTLIQGAFGNMLNSSEPLRIGVYKTITGNWFGQYSGLIEEVRIWDNGVTDSDILARYNSPLTGSEPGLQGYYNMDISGSGTGTIVPNSATSSPTGVIDGVASGTGMTPSFISSTSTIVNSLFGNDTTICIGENLLLDAGGYSGDYLWQDGSSDTVFTVTQPGLYHVQISVGCEIFGDSIQVSYAPIPTVNLGNDTLLCQGESLNLSAVNVTGATGFLWQDSSTNSNFLVSQPGVYSVFVDVGGCQGYDDILVEYSALQLELGPQDSIICSAANLILDVSQPNTNYLWQDGSVSATYPVSGPGLYSVKISDAACELEDSINIIINEISANFSFETTPQCGSTPVEYQDLSTINFGVISALTWFVDGREAFYGSSPVQLATATNVQSVKLLVTSSFGCKSEVTLPVPVEVFPLPVVNFVSSVLSPSTNEEVYYENTSISADSFLWQFEDGFSSNKTSVSHSFAGEGIFKVELTGYNSLCSNSIFKYFTIKPPLRYYVPNSFTPFNGQLNQVFLPVFTSGYDPYAYSLTIYNRWGEILFVSKNANVGWDGTYNSEILKNGVYVWQIEYVDIEINERVIANGTVTLVH